MQNAHDRLYVCTVGQEIHCLTLLNAETRGFVEHINLMSTRDEVACHETVGRAIVRMHVFMVRCQEVGGGTIHRWKRGSVNKPRKHEVSM